ncbi:MAG: hypothetical protein FWG65_08580 [Turicibacter sp.]|nr:hypothetical protein [Turicibacter sp.]
MEISSRYLQIVRDNYESNVESGNAAVQYMHNSTAIYKGLPVDCLYMPKLFSKDVWDYLCGAADTICKILDKVIERYLDDAEYRKLFPFSAELEELILTEAGYPRLLPIARLDIFFNEEDFSFKFCEFNADGASAMNEDRELNIAISNSHAMQSIKNEYRITSFEFFDSWVREFADIYGKYDNAVSNPQIVIADFIDSTVPNEFIEFKKAFEKAGFRADICEIRQLTYKGGILQTPEGKKIDVIYRRAVTRDIMEKRDEVQAIIAAAKDNAVCFIGHFRTQIIHHKMIFQILRQHETLSFLDEKEREYIWRHIPATMPLSEGFFDMDAVIERREGWIIKPYDYYGSKGVYAGADFSAEEWKQRIVDCMGKSYLLQEYHKPFQSLNLDFNSSKRPNFKLYNNITGMFVYNGKLQGLYSRAGLQPIISGLTGGLTCASLLATQLEE